MKKEISLHRHKDRPSCEISTTLHLGGDRMAYLFRSILVTNNILSGRETTTVVKPGAPKGIRVDLKVGDMLIYSGCELEHWREPFEGNICSQVFLHYNHANGPLCSRRISSIKDHC